jgi:hypothetical protein
MTAKQSNPKTHDSLFKWLITSFIEEFFEHYFPNVNIGQYEFIDKEFISKYEALKESLKGDLFIAVEIEIDNSIFEIVIHIEHKSDRAGIPERVFEYLCYAWLLKKKPVWSIVIYTDDAVWRKRAPEDYWYAFNSKQYCQSHKFDVIKVKDEKSNVLINKKSLICKLLALKANDEGANPEALIREIYRAVADMKNQLTNDQLLLVEQFVSFYKKIPDKTFEQIKKEVKMSDIATTISDHIKNEGKNEGKIEGNLEGKISILESLFQQAILTKEQFEQMIQPLRKKYNEICFNNTVLAQA